MKNYTFIVVLIVGFCSTVEARSVLEDISATTKKAFSDTGKTLEIAVDDVSDTTQKAFSDTGKTGDKALNDVLDELGRFAKRVCEDWLNIPDGDCNLCWTSKGGENGEEEEEGELYACEGGDPNKGTPPSQVGSDTDIPTEEELDTFANWKKETNPNPVELKPWYGGLSKYVPGNELPFNPLPKDMIFENVTRSKVVRNKGCCGLGYFLAPRAIYKNKKLVGVRYHGGVDFVTVPGETVFSPISGKIARFPPAYGEDHRGLTAIVIEKNGYEAKVLYVKPSTGLKIGDTVTAGAVIGTAQDLSVKHVKGMQNHVHVTILDPQKNRVSFDKEYIITPRKL